MNRQQRRATKRMQQAYVTDMRLGNKLTPISPEEFPSDSQSGNAPLVLAWRSNKYLVQVYQEWSPLSPHLKRMSVCRTTLNAGGGWKDGLTWDELQAIKTEIGYGDWYGVEVYPPDMNVVKVANFRHIWLMPEPLPIGWV